MTSVRSFHTFPIYPIISIYIYSILCIRLILFSLSLFHSIFLFPISPIWSIIFVGTIVIHMLRWHWIWCDTNLVPITIWSMYFYCSHWILLMLGEWLRMRVKRSRIHWYFSILYSLPASIRFWKHGFHFFFFSLLWSV